MSIRCDSKMKKLCGLFALILIFIGFILYGCASRDDSLQLVHVLFRHGERSPSKPYTNDPYKDYPWPGGWDQLTTRGKQQEYQLGIALRKRYRNFLDSQYDSKTFLVESSYADRCLMSAQLLLAGFFPPVGDDVWNDELMWQPIPVHTLPRYLDNKIAIKKQCPVFQAALNKSYDDLANDNLQNLQLYNYLTEKAGEEIRNIRSLETLYNTLEIELLNGLQLPEWTLTVFPDKMRDLAASSLAIFTNTTLMKRLHGGVLVKEILDNMDAKLLKASERKMVMYSGHDLTVVTLLRVLGFPKLIKPDFGASVLIELHKFNPEDYVVKFFYVANPETSPEELLLDGCGERGCNLRELRQMLAEMLPEDWERECVAH